MTGPFDIFISYCRRDNASGWVTALKNLVAAEASLPGNRPVRLFFDCEDIRGFDDWRHRIQGALRHSKVLLVCLSPAYFNSDYCLWEWQQFVQRRGPKYLRGDGEAIQAVRFGELNGCDSVHSTEWTESVRRSTTVNLSPWFAASPALLQTDCPARREALRVVHATAERVRRARRELAMEHGNMRAANEYFVGRRRQLRELHEQVSLGGVGVITALHGLGGIGKTELAVFYANEYARSFPGGIWWIDSATHRDLRVALAGLVSVPGFVETPPAFADDEQRYLFVLSTLRTRAHQLQTNDPDGGGQVLVLLDNVEHLELLGANQRVWVSRQSWLSILATTRTTMLSWEQADKLTIFTLDALDFEDALALIREWQPSNIFHDVSEERAARSLVTDLGCYTLAVEQAAIYLGTHPKITIREFHANLRLRGMQTLDDVCADQDVRSTMQHREKQLSLVLEQTLPLAGSLERMLMNYSACFGPDAIPTQWVEELTSGRLDSTEYSFEVAWQWLELRRLVVGKGSGPLKRMHRLVAAHVRTTTNIEFVQHFMNSKVKVIEAAFSSSPVSWEITALIGWQAQTTGESWWQRATRLYERLDE